jgi:hypothetical protein
MLLNDPEQNGLFRPARFIHACGAALALIYTKRINPEKYKNIAAIVCGGSGVTLERLEDWKNKVGIL